MDIVQNVLTRERLKEVGIDIPHAEQVYGILNYDGKEGVLVIYVEGGNANPIIGKTIADVRKAVSEMKSQDATVGRSWRKSMQPGQRVRVINPISEFSGKTGTIDVGDSGDGWVKISLDDEADQYIFEIDDLEPIA